MEIGYLAALLGGTLALLSPCGALLLPAFFASTLGAGRRLLLHAAVFYVGLTLTLVPLGLGAGALGSALAGRRETVVLAAGVLIIALGVAQALGLGFDLGRLLPGGRRWEAAARRRGGLARTVALGAVSGVAGFCAGPILGAVLTLAAGGGSTAAGGVMLAVYGLGMVLPLVALSWVWARRGEQVGRERLRGREVRLGLVRTHSVSLVTGLVLVAVGTVFLATNGMQSLPELVPARSQAAVQSWVLAAGRSVPDVALVLLGAAVALVAWWGWVRRRTVHGVTTGTTAVPVAPPGREDT